MKNTSQKLANLEGNYTNTIKGSEPSNANASFQTNTLDWSFSEKYYKSIGFTVHGFTFAFTKVKTQQVI